MNNDDIVAVSSLESVEHATRKDPKIISAVWFIGKRCNYDCSYCSPYLHDNYSPHISFENACHFIDSLSQYCDKIKKKIKFSISGGEPFIHPRFLQILQHIRSKKNVMMLSVVSNGSLPLEMYETASQYITNLTISLHLEQPEKVISNTVEKILKLNENKSLFLNVNLMAVPGKLDLIKSIKNKFDSANVKYVIRKIDPPSDQYYKKITKTEYLKHGEDLNQYFQDKINFKNYTNQQLEEYWKAYYSPEELEFLKTSNQQVKWNNIRLHTVDGQIETNTDDLKSRGKNNWKDWHCFIGIDSLNIQFDGTIYRGQCMIGDPIGKIGESFNWPESTIICPLAYCECNADMPVRKVKNTKYLGIVDES